MDSKVIKIGKDNYGWLATLAAKIQQEEARPISFDEAISILKREHEKITIELKDEMSSWQETSLKDSINFWKKQKL